jgi:hypothetical protein
MAFRYDTSGRWYKGNTHIHTTASDGGQTPSEVAALYASADYSFLFATDHWVAATARNGHTPAPVLWLEGVELDGRDDAGHYYHVVCLGATDGIHPAMGFTQAVESAQAQGALLILAHPFWTGNSLSDGERFRFHGVEIYNHVCQWLNGKGDGRVFWNDMLLRNREVLAFASDDAHLWPGHPGWNGGWIVANASELSAEAITAAIRAGNYYSSCGPEFHGIACDGSQVSITTSPVKFVRLVGPGFLGERIGDFDDRMITEAVFDMPPNWDYAYLEIEDSQGRRAWTNNLFTK